MDAASIKRIWSISDRLALLRPCVAAEASQSLRRSHQAIAKPSHDQNHDTHRRRIQSILLKHEAVAQATVSVIPETGDISGDEFEAFITTHKLNEGDRPHDTNKSASSNANDQNREQRVEFWADYWNTLVYSAVADLDLGSIGRDFLGWTSLYDGKEIDKVEMNEWLDETIETIGVLCNGGETQLLEIGMGSGMILFNIVDKVQSYVGIEMSPTAVNFINEVLQSRPDLLDTVHTLQGTAAELSTLQIPTEPDLVIINSVAQYFPTQQYLLDVIKAVGNMQSVRKLFLGDVRSLALYDEFLFSKALHDLGERATGRELQSSMSTSAQREMELLIDPGFFSGLQHRLSGLISHVEILPKRMHAANELSRYRYGVVIHFNRQPETRAGVRMTLRDVDAADGNHVDFVREKLDAETLEHRLRTSASETLLVSNIPNVKTSVDSRLVDIQTRSGPAASEDYDVQSPGWISRARLAAERHPAMSTLDILEVARKIGYKVDMSAARQFSQRGGIDAIFYRDNDGVKCSDASSLGTTTRFRFPTDHEGRDVDSLTTHPMRLQAQRDLVEELRESMQAELPVHLIPRQIHVVKNLPANRGHPALQGRVY